MAVTILDLPVKLPAKCSKCGSPYSQDGRKYIDTGIDVLRYGRIYICTLCFDEYAQSLNYVSQQTAMDAGRLILDLEKVIQELEVENNELRAAVSSLGFLTSLARRENPPEQVTWDTEAGERSAADDSTRGNQKSSIPTAKAERDTPVRKSGSTEPRKSGRPPNLSAAFEIDLNS